MEGFTGIFDMHMHCHVRAGMGSERDLLEGMEKIMAVGASYGVTRFNFLGTFALYDTEEMTRQLNDQSMRITREWPGVVSAFCYINALHGVEASRRELDRCLGEGNLVGVKSELECNPRDPLFRPLAEKAIEYGVPLLQHTWNHTPLVAPGRHGKQREAGSADVAWLAREYPELTIIMAHLTGCGVRGGKQHDFILAGNANEDTEVSLDRELTPFNGTLLNPGVVFTKPTASGQLGNRAETGLGYIINLRFAPDAEQVRFDTRLKAEPNLGVRSWVNAGAGTVVYLGEAPAVRPAGESEARRDDFLMPMLVARRQKDHSVFVAVHEPIADGRSAIDAVDVERRDDAVVLSIRREATTDVLFVAMDEQATLSYATPNGIVDFAGRQGMLRIRDGKPVAMHLVGGTLLRFGGTELTGAESVRGKITGIGHGQTDGSGWFDIAEQVDPAMAVSALITRLPDGTTQAYNIAAIEATADGSRILVNEAPAIDITADKIAMRYFPLREITGGTVTYELIPSLHRIID